MKIDNDFEQEVNQIRLALYEETKNMTPAEVNEYYRKSTDDVMKEYGFRVVTQITAKQAM